MRQHTVSIDILDKSYQVACEPEQEAELQALRRLSRRTDMRKRPPGGWGPDGPPRRLLELAENGRAAKARRQAAARDAA